MAMKWVLSNEVNEVLPRQWNTFWSLAKDINPRYDSAMDFHAQRDGYKTWVQISKSWDPTKISQDGIDSLVIAYPFRKSVQRWLYYLDSLDWCPMPINDNQYSSKIWNC